MFTNNPFAEVPAFITPSMLQTYVIIMIALVAIGTIYDVLHKKSARYFMENMKKSKAKASKEVGAGEAMSLAVKTAVVDVAASGEFCNLQRRIAHLLTMYGFIAFIAGTIMIAYSEPFTSAPPIAAQLWHIGALMVCIGGYWFWFFIRVDVAAEGSSTVPGDVRGHVCSVAARQHDLCAWLWSISAVERQFAWNVVFFLAAHPVHDFPVLHSTVVEVRAHVLQTCRRVREAHVGSQRVAK